METDYAYMTYALEHVTDRISPTESRAAPASLSLEARLAASQEERPEESPEAGPKATREKRRRTRRRRDRRALSSESDRIPQIESRALPGILPPAGGGNGGGGNGGTKGDTRRCEGD